MSLAFFTPNKSITGGCVLWKFNSKEEAIFAACFKQVAMNPDKKNNFDFKNVLNVKFSLSETAGLIRAVRTKSEFSCYHSFNDVVTTASLKYYKKDKDNQGNPLPKSREGFGMSVKRDTTEIKVNFTLQDAELLIEYLRFALDHCFSANYQLDKQKAKEAAEKKKQQTSVQEPVPEPEFVDPSAGEEDDDPFG